MATIYDVARLANVSSMTVSRALNTPGKVKLETRQRIDSAVAELGYQKNQAARALVLQSTGIVKIQMSAGLRGNHLYFSQLFAGITEVLSEHKLAMLVTDHNSNDDACDGAIIMGLTRTQQMRFVPSETPKVLFGKSHAGIDWVDVDNEEGCYFATQHLIKLGHERIGFFTFPSTEPFIVERESGYTRAMAEAGLRTQDCWRVMAENNSVEAGYAAGRPFVEQGSVTAMVCCSDHIGVGLAQAAYDAAVRVPEDLSIIGYDGVGQERMAKPILSTMRQPVFDIGKRLAKLLVERIKVQSSSVMVKELVSPELVLNDSVAPPLGSVVYK